MMLCDFKKSQKALQVYDLSKLTMKKFGVMHQDQSNHILAVILVSSLSVMTQLDLASNFGSSGVQLVFLVMCQTSKANKLGLRMKHWDDV